jgi:hypothetical protein
VFKVMDSDPDLLERARAGDRVALGLLIERRMPLVLHVCRRMVGSRGGREDSVQEAALQAMLGLDTLRDPTEHAIQESAELLAIDFDGCRRRWAELFPQRVRQCG